MGTDLNNLNLYTITTNRELNITNLDYARTYYIEVYPLDFNKNRLSVIPAKLTFTTGFDNRTITQKPVVTLDEVSDSYTITSWNDIANSDAYGVYRSDDNISYEFLFKTKDTKFIDNINLIPGKTYFYKIKAFNNNASMISNALEVKIPEVTNICEQVITHAYNPTTGEEKDFATPCDVPEDWIVGNIPENIKLNLSLTPSIDKLVFDNKHQEQNLSLAVDSLFGDDLNISIKSSKDIFSVTKSWSDNWIQFANYHNQSMNIMLKLRENIKDSNDTLLITLKDEHNNKIVKKLDVSIKEGNFYIYGGWNLKALPVNKEINVSEFSNVDILWKWNSIKQSWSAWSPISSVMDSIKQYAQGGKIAIAKHIEPAEGFWIYSKEEDSKNFTAQAYGLEKLHFTKGWNLIGFGKAISVDSLKDKDIQSIWQYSNAKWKVWGKNLDNSSIYDKYSKITNIDATDGFWIFSRSDYNATNQAKNGGTIIIKEGNVAKITYNLGDKSNCKINFADGVEKYLAQQCSGSIEHIYTKPGVYVPKFYSDNQEVNSTIKNIIIVENSVQSWDGYVTSLNNYVEANERSSDFYKEGTLYISPNLSEKSDYWTNFAYFTVTAFQGISANNFTLTAKVKDSSEDGGLSAYDVSIRVYTDTGKSIGASMMGESSAISSVHIWAGDKVVSGIDKLVLNFNDYRNIKYVVKDGNFTIYSDGNELYSLPFSDELGKVVGISVSFKGSGRLSGINLYE